jgi:hypothetical protein
VSEDIELGDRSPPSMASAISATSTPATTPAERDLDQQPAADRCRDQTAELGRSTATAHDPNQGDAGDGDRPTPDPG